MTTTIFAGLNRNETWAARDIAEHLVAGEKYVAPLCFNRGRILIAAGRLALLWEREGVAGHVAGVR